MNKDEIEIEKPCLKLGWCPYGSLVESFPLLTKGKKDGCNVFGHMCPAFYHAEGFVDE